MFGVFGSVSFCFFFCKFDPHMSHFAFHFLSLSFFLLSFVTLHQPLCIFLCVLPSLFIGLCFMSGTHSCVFSCFAACVSHVSLGCTGLFSFSVCLGSCFVARVLLLAFGFVDFSFILLKLTFIFVCLVLHFDPFLYKNKQISQQKLSNASKVIFQIKTSEICWCFPWC